MEKNIVTQKIYTFPERKLYGEYCATSLLALRLQIVKGEIKEELCYLDSNGFAYVFDEYGVPDKYHEEYLDTKNTKLLQEILKVQMEKRMCENK